MSEKISITLKVWRQSATAAPGCIETYQVPDIDTDASFLEMLDVVNEGLTLAGKAPIAFDHDCREGICGMCGAVVNGIPHGPQDAITLCQLHMRSFANGDTITLEPWRAKAFPIVKDLIVDRSSFDRIIASGGFISVKTGSAQDANAIPIGKPNADKAMSAASCIGCGACVAACPNASAMLFVGAKVSQFALLPQGQVERKSRVDNMVRQMDAEGFGNCTNELECEAACPKEISVEHIARMNKEHLVSKLF